MCSHAACLGRRTCHPPALCSATTKTTCQHPAAPPGSNRNSCLRRSGHKRLPSRRRQHQARQLRHLHCRPHQQASQVLHLRQGQGRHRQGLPRWPSLPGRLQLRLLLPPVVCPVRRRARARGERRSQQPAGQPRRWSWTCGVRWRKLHTASQQPSLPLAGRLLTAAVTTTATIGRHPGSRSREAARLLDRHLNHE